IPPFTEMFARVRSPASSEARNATTAAISPAPARRPMGIEATICSRVSGRIAITTSVSTYPAATASPVAPFLTTSCARALAQPAEPLVLLLVARQAARDHGVAGLPEALADRGADAAHAAGDERDPLDHLAAAVAPELVIGLRFQ